MAERYDLVVVGAGPGGSSAAYHSAKAGLSTLLIDRQMFPRDKTCGDGLMPHAASEVALLVGLTTPTTASSLASPFTPTRPTCARASLLPCTVLGATS
jgi:flavin-dependent dehydrogenase